MSAGPEKCDVCASALRPLYARVRDPQTGEVFRIDQCIRCGLGHTLPRPDDLARYYGPAYHGGRYGFAERLCLNRRLRFVRAVTQPKTLLDFGCGDGAFLDAAAKLGWQATGVEMSPRLARARGLRVVERIEEAAGPFNAVTLWHSLEHVPSPRTVMQAVGARLAPGGTVIVAVPNLDGVQARVFREDWFHLDVPRHLFHFTPAAVTRLFEGAGLGIVRRWNLESEQDLFGWTQSALNQLLPRPNVLFETLTGRGAPATPGETVASFALGSVFTVAAAPIVLLAAAAARGAVAVFAAKKLPGT